jgi:hypothetical protein
MMRSDEGYTNGISIDSRCPERRMKPLVVIHWISGKELPGGRGGFNSG